MNHKSAISELGLEYELNDLERLSITTRLAAIRISRSNGEDTDAIITFCNSVIIARREIALSLIASAAKMLSADIRQNVMCILRRPPPEPLETSGLLVINALKVITKMPEWISTKNALCFPS